ncbi:MAG: hypothetical protein ACYSSM_01290, partial [Planctomycetota bacterium]
MKKSLFLLAVMCLAGVAGAAGEPVCLLISPSNAGVNDQVTLSAYDASDNWVDMRNFTAIEICFDDGLCIFNGGGLDVSSGDGVFTLTQAILNGYKFDCDFYNDSPPPDSTWFTLVNPGEPSPPFNSISAAIAAGGTCSVSPPPTGEVLYNGIVLPQTWPPQYGSVPYTPMPVPYLTNPPATVPIDVGRQLFVDDFLVDTTDMTRTYHQATYYTAGNPVLTPTTVEEHGPEGNMMAGPFSGGAWYDPADNLFKMWYRGGMSGVHGIQSQLYATSTDGKNWDRPKLDVNPVGVLENFTCTPSNPTAGQQVTIAAFDANYQQVDLSSYDTLEFCWAWERNVCISAGSGITFDANGGAVFTCTQAILDALPGVVNFKLLAQKTGSPSLNEEFLLPFPFDPVT